MSKKIEIEFCAENGLGGPALKLRKSIQQAFPGVEIDYREANGATGRIEVAWSGAGIRNIVWSNNKTDTENNHPTIVENLRLAAWSAIVLSKIINHSIKAYFLSDKFAMIYLID